MQIKAEQVIKQPHTISRVERAQGRSVDYAGSGRSIASSALSLSGRSPQNILRLQRMVGNRGVGSLLQSNGAVVRAISAQVPLRLLQRAPAPAAGGGKAAEKPAAAPAKPGLQLSNDEWIWVLETFRRDSPGDFVRLLEKHEGEFYPILKPYGFQGSWVDEQRYLTDFDAAVAKWGKSHTYFNRTVSAIRAAPAAKAETPEDWRYHQAQLLRPQLSQHGHTREEVNDRLESSGLMEDLERHGFERAGTYSFTNSEAYQNRAVQALNQYIDRYRAAHGLGTGPTADVPSQGAYDMEFIRAWLEGLSYVSNSPMAALAAGAAMKFTDDPKKIAAAAGMGAAFEGAVGSVAAGFGGRDSYSPEVVGPRDRPTAVRQERYTGAAPTEPVREPDHVGAPPAQERIPTPDPVSHPENPAHSADSPAQQVAPPEPASPNATIDEHGKAAVTNEATNAAPVKAAPTKGRLIDSSTPDRYVVSDSANRRLQVFGVIEDGELTLTMRTRLESGERSEVLRGEEQFRRVVQHFGGRIKGIRGSWSFGDNLQGFNAATGSGVPPETAALQTWTGKQASAAGFTRVSVRNLEGKPGSYTTVVVVFLR